MIELPLPPSPGTENHVSIDLVNSIVHLPGVEDIDALITPESTTEWLIDRDLVAEGSALQSYCQSRLTGLRWNLQEAFEACATGRALDQQTLANINAALVAAPHVAQLQTWPDGSFTRTTEHPVTQLVEHAMSIIAEDAAALLSSDEAQLLTRCEAEPCTRFYLRTHARRQWCSTRCGDRVRAARAYARRQAKKQEGLKAN